MNRPDCPGHVPAYPSLSTTAPVTFKVTADPLSACWTSDPVPEGNVRAYADIPAGAVFVPFGNGTVIAGGGCLDPICLNCPECCGSRSMPNRCGDFSDPPGVFICCECGDDYTLTISERAQSVATGTHYADPCTVYPSIGTQQSWDSTVTHEATFHFGCEEVDGGPEGTFLRRKVTGQSVVTIRRNGYYARIVYTVGPGTCSLVSFGAGRTETFEEEFTNGWESFLGEGCGLTLRQVARLGPEDWSVTRTSRGLGYGIARFINLGECFGQHAEWTPGCSDDLGGPFNPACRFGLAAVGFSVAWSGSQGCDGGTFEETGTFANLAAMRVEEVVNGVQTPGDPSWQGAEAGSWSYSCTWAKTGGAPCQQPPCEDQQPAGLIRERIKRERAARNVGRLLAPLAIDARASTGLTRDQLLDWAASPSRAGGCGGCGKT